MAQSGDRNGPLRTFDQRVEGSGTAPAGIGAGEQIIFAAMSRRARNQIERKTIQIIVGFSMGSALRP
jgi:hypothetical protein